jgi:hypothetical protein
MKYLEWLNSLTKSPQDDKVGIQTRTNYKKGGGKLREKNIENPADELTPRRIKKIIEQNSGKPVFPLSELIAEETNRLKAKREAEERQRKYQK